LREEDDEALRPELSFSIVLFYSPIFARMDAEMWNMENVGWGFGGDR
jgi:hypothetical protein